MRQREEHKKLLLANPTERSLEQEWAKYKYWVMSRSQKAYLELRRLFKEGADVQSFYKILDDVEHCDDPKAQTNAFEHVWGYFKKDASLEETQTFVSLLESFRKGLSSKEDVYLYLYQMAIKYQSEYLLESYYFEDYK